PRRGRGFALAPGAAALRRAAARGGARGVRARGRDPRRDPPARERGPGRAGGEEPMSDPRRDLDALVARPSPWLDGGGPKSDIVVSPRVRLARNLRHVPFTHPARDEQLPGVISSITNAGPRSPAFQNGMVLAMTQQSPAA